MKISKLKRTSANILIISLVTSLIPHAIMILCSYSSICSYLIEICLLISGICFITHATYFGIISRKFYNKTVLPSILFAIWCAIQFFGVGLYEYLTDFSDNDFPALLIIILFQWGFIALSAITFLVSSLITKYKFN